MYHGPVAIWIALFRGINVSGNNLLPMKELKLELEKLGCTDIATYIQSGNVVFRHAKKLTTQIGKAIANSHGFEPDIMMLSVKQLEAAATSNPYREAEAEPKTLHLSFLAEPARHPDLDTLNRLKSDNESFTLRDRVFYLHAPDGIGRSRLAARVEKALGVAATGRNWRTVGKLIKLAQGCKG